MRLDPTVSNSCILTIGNLCKEVVFCGIMSSYIMVAFWLQFASILQVKTRPVTPQRFCLLVYLRSRRHLAQLVKAVGGLSTSKPPGGPSSPPRVATITNLGRPLLPLLAEYGRTPPGRGQSSETEVYGGAARSVDYWGWKPGGREHD
jgi:hypothetical protein